MASATAPTAIAIRRLEVQQGPGAVLIMVSRLLGDVDKLCGSKCTVDELELMTRMAVQTFRHRSVESLVLALQNGIKRTDKDGKIYGKLTWPTLLQWLNDHEDSILALAEGQHASKVVRGDNYTFEDDPVHQDNRKDVTISRQSKLIDHLKNQLDARKGSE